MTSTHEFEEGAAAFRQQLSKGNKAPFAISPGQEFELLRLNGAVVTVAVTDDVVATPTQATNPSNDPAAGSRQQKLRAIALENAVQAIHTGELYILHEPGKTPRERTHDPETGYPIRVLPVGDPEANALFNEAMRAHFRGQKAAKEETKVITSIQFKVLRVENPPGTRNILLHFERDSNYGLAIEVWQDVTRLQGRPGPAPDQRDWRQKEWVGVNGPRVLRWVLPQEFSPDEAKALAKEMEKKWKGSHPLPDGAVPEFAAALHRDGWKYHLVARVLREPGSPRPPVPGNALVGVRLDQSSQDGPKTELGERLLFKTAANRATGFILRWHAYPAQQGKFGNRWILDWVDPDTGVIFHRIENSFIKPVKLTSPAVPPLPLVSAARQLAEPGTSVPFRLLRAEESTVRGAAPTAWWMSSPRWN